MRMFVIQYGDGSYATSKGRVERGYWGTREIAKAQFYLSHAAASLGCPSPRCSMTFSIEPVDVTVTRA